MDENITQPLPTPGGEPAGPTPSVPAPVPAPPAPGPGGHAFGASPYATPARPGAADGGPAGHAPIPPHPTTRPARTWPAVVSTAAVTALLVGGGAAFATTQLIDRSATPSGVTSTVTDLGTSSPISVDAVSPASWEEVAARVAASVVAIDVQTSAGGGQGSGVIIDTEGHILTNNHVVAGARNDTVTVTLSDGRLYDAKIVGLDASTDLAVVKLVSPPANLAAATLADSDKVVVGNAVMAVGNPLGLANTVTTGIVSAVDRPVSTSDGSRASAVVTNAIQIDAAVNPGNSGGPLFDAAGQVIGITSSIATLSSGSGQSGSIGLGFAIPSNLARSVGDQLMAKGSAEHAFLGVSLRDATATADGATRRGAEVVEVTPGSAAAKGGVEAGDVIVAIDGKAVSGAEYLTAAVRERVEGDRAVLTVVRAGTAKDVTVTLAARADAAGDGSTPGREGSDGSQDQEGRQAPDGGSEGTLPGGMTQEEFFRWLRENL
ncbi:S1C family serine protease [Sanguibacter sp. A247]|uniref:S1C family serine protease n=1 Tax=unclassified Sanguibacter TaxID=2645534 RepID=UPI003FD7237C